jgi:hypothetical protein
MGSSWPAMGKRATVYSGRLSEMDRYIDDWTKESEMYCTKGNRQDRQTEQSRRLCVYSAAEKKTNRFFNARVYSLSQCSICLIFSWKGFSRVSALPSSDFSTPVPPWLLLLSLSLKREKTQIRWWGWILFRPLWQHQPSTASIQASLCQSSRSV